SHMIQLHGKLQLLSPRSSGRLILSLTTNQDLPTTLASQKGLLSDGSSSPAFKVVFHKGTPAQLSEGSHHFLLPADLHYLAEGDVVRINLEDGSFRVLFRKLSKHNSILLTEQCNHYCLMCSQPPKKIDDSWILEEAKELIQLIPQGTIELGFTG